MKNRIYSYGYCVKDGKLNIIDHEVAIVREIFNSYIQGRALSQIAAGLVERQIEFYNGVCNWNKNTISRIIANKKYIGDKGYIPIINEEIFNEANEIKGSKDNGNVPCSPEIKYLKGITYCEHCGEMYYRRPLWSTRERWICRNGCKTGKYIADDTIISEIRLTLKRIQDNNSLVQVTSESVKYRKTQEIIRYNNEISRMTNANNPSFNVVKKMIFECASLKFKECKEDTAQSYNDYVLKSINEIADRPLTIKDLQSLIISIGIDLNGEMTIKFKNGAKIKNGQTKE